MFDGTKAYNVKLKSALVVIHCQFVVYYPLNGEHGDHTELNVVQKLSESQLVRCLGSHGFSARQEDDTRAIR